MWTRRKLGWLLLLPFLAGVGVLGYYARDWHHFVDLAFDPTRLRIVGVAIGVLFVIWAFTVVTTYAITSPARWCRSG